MLLVLVISAVAGARRQQTEESSLTSQWWSDSPVGDSHKVERRMCRQSTTLYDERLMQCCTLHVAKNLPEELSIKSRSSEIGMCGDLCPIIVALVSTSVFKNIYNYHDNYSYHYNYHDNYSLLVQSIELDYNMLPGSTPF